MDHLYNSHLPVFPAGAGSIMNTFTPKAAHPRNGNIKLHAELQKNLFLNGRLQV
jgi:hypothetical protein